MAHPLQIMESAVQLFVDHWRKGLQPQLTLDTQENGAISVNFSVDSFSFKAPTREHSDISLKRHSGRNARLRRNKRRFDAQNVLSQLKREESTSEEKSHVSVIAGESIPVSKQKAETIQLELSADDTNDTSTLPQLQPRPFHHEISQKQILNVQSSQEIDFGVSPILRALPITTSTSTPSPILEPNASIALPISIPNDYMNSPTLPNSSQKQSSAESTLTITSTPSPPPLNYDHSQFFKVFKEKLDEALRNKVANFLKDVG